MKLKQRLEDFKVEEINTFKIKNKGRYKLYLLEKRGLETFSLLRYLSKQNKIPFSDFGIAGLKDRHGITKQYFTIPSQYSIKTLNEKNFDIKFLGHIDNEIKLGSLKGNKFDLIVRAIRKGELEAIYKKSETLEKIGVPNYFDSQRFGSVIARKFIAKFVLQKNYEEAVKLYLTRYTKHENKKLKEEKRNLFKNWNKVTQLKLTQSFIINIINTYKETKSWLEAYKKIPSYLRKMFFSAYQSYLWNECIKEILKKIIDKKKLYPIKYDIGDLLFYKNIPNEELEKIPLTFKTISNADYQKDELEIINTILICENLSLKDFNDFRLSKRKIILKPEDFKISSYEKDEINKNRFKINLNFNLSKGSYATIITKRLFNK